MEELMETGWIFSRLYCSDPRPELWLMYQRDDPFLQLLVSGKQSKDRRGQHRNMLPGKHFFQGETAHQEDVRAAAAACELLPSAEETYFTSSRVLMGLGDS